MSFSPMGKADSAPPNPSVGFEGPFRGGKKGRREERREKKGRKGMGKPSPTPRYKFLVTALVPNVTLHRENAPA